MLGVFGEVTKDTFASAPGRERFELSRKAHELWGPRLEDLRERAAAEGDPLHEVEATNVILNSRSGSLDSLNFAAMIDALEACGEPWEELDPSDIAGLDPRPLARPLRAVHLPSEGAVDARQVLDLVDRKVRAAGARVVDADVTSLQPVDAGDIELRCGDGAVLAARQVVVAAGAVSGRLLETALGEDSVVPMYAGAGVSLVGERVTGVPFEAVVRTPNRSGSCGLHLIPLGASREYVGATNVLFGEPQLREWAGVSHFLLDCATNQLDQQIYFHRVEEWRNGNRPVALDGFPLVGATEVDGLYAVSGTYRDGFHCSPALAERLADELLGGKVPETAFAPQRRALMVRSVDEAVEDFAVHSVGGWSEFGAAPPGYVPTCDLEAMFARQARDLHARLGLTAGLPPEVTMFLLEPTTDQTAARSIADHLEGHG